MINIDQLLTYPLFRNLQSSALEEILQCVHVQYRSFPKGYYLAMTEDEIRYIGIVCKGSVQMVHMRPGELFGETFVCSALFASKVSFVTAEKTEILFLNYDRVMHTCSLTCRYHHRLIENMLQCIAEKNMRLMEKIEIVSKKTLRDKLMTYLSFEAQKQGTDYFTIPLGRMELAEYLCADRSAITRELVSMQEDGLITFEKNQFRILIK